MGGGDFFFIIGLLVLLLILDFVDFFLMFVLGKVRYEIVLLYIFLYLFV